MKVAPNKGNAFLRQGNHARGDANSTDGQLLMKGREFATSLSGKQVMVAVVWCLLIISLIALMFPRGREFQFSDLKNGDIYIGKDVIAPFTFSIVKSPEEYESDVTREIERVTKVFVLDSALAQSQLGRLSKFLEGTKQIRELHESDSTKIRRLDKLIAEHNLLPTDEARDGLIQFCSGRGVKTRSSKTGTGRVAAAQFSALATGLLSITEDIYAKGIIENPSQITIATNELITVIEGESERQAYAAEFYTIESAENETLNRIREVFGGDEMLTKVGYPIVSAYLLPNIHYEHAKTELRIAQARSRVPTAKGTILKDELVLENHERVTEQHVDILRSLSLALAESEVKTGRVGLVLTWMGRLLLISASIFLFLGYLKIDNTELAHDRSGLVMTSILVLLVLLCAYFVELFELSPYVIPFAIAPMLLTIFFTPRVGVMATLPLALILGGMRSNEFAIVVIGLLVGCVAVYSVSRVRTRSWLMRSIVALVLTNLLAITTIEFLRYESMSHLAMGWLYAVLNGFFSPIIAYGLLVIFEYLFDLTTDMKLLELSDLNRPLLRQLAIRAPGTYHHSILVGNLCEAAAEAIGANSLLARVGAYYHDIGKMYKADYFVENQVGGQNPHDKLSPSMSSLILANHVRRGLEIAREHRLPREIRNFIAEHHGTCVMSFFYKKALDKSEGEQVNEADYRYPGPLPHSKETGICFLADSVEAATRSLQNPSTQKIQARIKSIVLERFRSGELDECPLTLRDLNKISQSFMNILIGVHQTRIEYPEQEEALARKVKRMAAGNVLET